MIHHASIAADRPRRVARVLAELWCGEALPFPPLPGAWMAFADDEQASLIEVLPHGVELMETPGDADVAGRINPDAPRATATHLAIASPLSEPHVLAIAAREGWSAKYRRRESSRFDDVQGFGVIELWIENRTLIEVMTREMTREYRVTMALPAWLARHSMTGDGDAAPRARFSEAA